MTTGIIDFMMSSGFKTPIELMPTPDLAVPYEAPRSKGVEARKELGLTCEDEGAGHSDVAEEGAAFGTVVCG